MTDRGPRLRAPSSYTGEPKLCSFLFDRSLKRRGSAPYYHERIERWLTLEFLEKL